MPVIFQQQVVLDRPLGPVEGLMDRVLRHPERETLPAAWQDTLQFRLLINSDLLDLDELNQTELTAFSRILKDAIIAMEAG